MLGAPDKLHQFARLACAISIAAVATILTACDQTIAITPETRTEAIDQDDAPPAEKKLKLKTGEWLKEVTYGSVTPVGRAKGALLTVEFETRAEPDLRVASLQELVTQKLLPSAVRDGYQAAQLWEKRAGSSVGPLNFSSSQTWTFERADGRQWRQATGTEIDWTIVQQNLTADVALSLSVPAKFVQRKWNSGDYQLELHTVASQGLSPREALESAAYLLANTTKCDQEAGEQPSFLSDDKLIAVTVYVYPEQKRDLLHIVPFVHFDLSRTDSRWTCDRRRMLDDIEKLDWSKSSDWDGLFR